MRHRVKNHELFSIFFALNILFKGIGLGNSSKIYLSFIIFGLFLVISKMIKDSYSQRDLIVCSTILLVGCITFVVTLKPTMLLTCITVVGMKNVILDKELKNAYKIRQFSFLIVVALALCGIIENVQVNMWTNGGFRERYSLGFEHPNSLHLALFLVISLSIVYRKERLRFTHYICFSVSNLFIYKYSGSRTGLIMIFALLVLTLFSRKLSGRTKKLYENAPICVFIICMVISYGFSLLYGKYRILDLLNNVLNNRLAYANYYLTHYPITLFGIKNIMLDVNAISDNTYTLVLLQFGVFGSLTWIFLEVCSWLSIKDRANSYEISVMIVLFLYMLTEGFGINIFMNYLLLFAGDKLLNRRRE